LHRGSHDVRDLPNVWPSDIRRFGVIMHRDRVIMNFCRADIGQDSRAAHACRAVMHEERHTVSDGRVLTAPQSVSGFKEADCGR
jgi:hypothetical protein